MTGGTGKKLGWKTILLVNKRLLVLIINKSNGDFLDRLADIKSTRVSFTVHYPQPNLNRQSQTRGYDKAFQC